MDASEQAARDNEWAKDRVALLITRCETVAKDLADTVRYLRLMGAI